MKQDSEHTVVILGAAYGGRRCAQTLAQILPPGWRLVVIDRNTHFNHAYVFPRYTVLSVHAPKAFVPYIKSFLPGPFVVQSTQLTQPIHSTQSTRPGQNITPATQPTSNTSPTKSERLTSPPTPQADGTSTSTPVKVDTSPSTHSTPTSPTKETRTEENTQGERREERIWIHGLVTSLTRDTVTFTRLSTNGPSYPSSDLFSPTHSTNSHPRSSSLSKNNIIAQNGNGHCNTKNIDGSDEGICREVLGEETIHFDYIVYALGATLPGPVDVWGGELHPQIGHQNQPLGHKIRGVRFMVAQAEVYKKVKSVIVVGGGALGIQTATDIKDVYPDKEVTLVHSRAQLLPIYPMEMHEGILQNLIKMNIQVILSERVIEWPLHPGIPSTPNSKTIRTTSGRTLTSDLVLVCTGQKPATTLMSSLLPESVDEKTRRIRVRPTMQLERIGWENWFAIGDCAETGSIQAGHVAWGQGMIAARNVVRLIKKEGDLEVYEKHGPAIKVTLGLNNAIISNSDGVRETGEGVEDLHADMLW
ncbi:hypothetical protein M231_02909 [Tremella mesenterica]|uniref:FAD/NAD(P)-binding domain-containing protein n=1 Tax=Tremella mesenterica TaxID=5217 RepID=A0A4Q1BPZ7_TREME|nr:hypothetical protein M231_02909 [Tremella mesenterica]